MRLDRSAPSLAAVVHFWNVLSRAFKWAAGSFIFCETHAFRKIGGFNLELFASEELDLSRRLKKLARKERKRVVILTGHPVVTSSRKSHLYTVREHLSFLLRTIVRFGKPLKSAQECFTWYDGRR